MLVSSRNPRGTRGVAATRLDGVSTRRSRRRRDSVGELIRAFVALVRSRASAAQVAFDETGAAAEPRGLARWKVEPEDLAALRAAQGAIKAAIAAPIAWAGGSDERDGRWRGSLSPRG